MQIGVLAVQGAVGEHVRALREVSTHDFSVHAVRRPDELANVQGLIIPGGESTTISRLLRSSGLQAPLVARAGARKLAVFGTCAGMILLAQTATHDVADKDIELLGLLDAEVDRNAFGRQRESFEADVDVHGLGTIPGIFIRAPVLARCWGDTQVLARSDKGIIAAQKGSVLATAFHPELTPNRRLHEYFVSLCADISQ